MTNGEYFVLTHPNVEVKENRTCVWIYNLDNTDCNHHTMSMEWWNEEMVDVRPKEEWIPINSVEDIPKDRMLFVTLDDEYDGCVETLYYDMTEWSDEEYARHAIAYMDYWEYLPKPYEGGE